MIRRKKLEALVGGPEQSAAGTSSVIGMKLARKDSMYLCGDQTLTD